MHDWPWMLCLANSVELIAIKRYFFFWDVTIYIYVCGELCGCMFFWVSDPSGTLIQLVKGLSFQSQIHPRWFSWKAKKDTGCVRSVRRFIDAGQWRRQGSKRKPKQASVTGRYSSCSQKATVFNISLKSVRYKWVLDFCQQNSVFDVDWLTKSKEMLFYLYGMLQNRPFLQSSIPSTDRYTSRCMFQTL